MNNAPSKRPFKGKKDFKKQKPRLRHKADLWGTHAVTAAWLNPDREVKALYITDAMLESFRSVMKEAAGLQRPEPQIIDKKEMDRMLPGAVHQGIAVDVAPLPETFVMDLVARTAAHKNSTILIL
ncbi:MAG: RNA methyltransferase substrate-binding domain-containing protein, partial [Pseudomonadota bacterium]|nr:RNA methyltransferase substrate-binding domain-containing protein [Pseudomonadota bacterium]